MVIPSLAGPLRAAPDTNPDLSFASTQELPTEEIIFDCQMRFDALVREYEGSLSAQEKFAASQIYDAIGMMGAGSDVPAALENINTLDQMKTFLNHGFFDANHVPAADMTPVLDRAKEILAAAHLEMPSCVFIQHFDMGFYGQKGGWAVILGEFKEDVAADAPDWGARMTYCMYFTGEELTLREFAIEPGTHALYFES